MGSQWAWRNEIQTVMRDDNEKLAESKCHLRPWSAAAKQHEKEGRGKKMNDRKKSSASNTGIPGERKAKYNTDRLQGNTDLLAFVWSLLPLQLRLEKAIVWHLVPVSPGCYKPAVKCNAFCHGCALRLLLLFGCGGIRAGTWGSTVHPKESRFHIPEWNAFWHCSASPWFE